MDFSAFGDRDRADRFFVSTGGDVFRRASEGGGGGALGVINLSAGFIVLMSPLAIELIDALRLRRGWTSIGTKRRLTGWPGRYGQDVVNGIDESWCSVPSSNSYYISREHRSLCNSFG